VLVVTVRQVDDDIEGGAVGLLGVARQRLRVRVTTIPSTCRPTTVSCVLDQPPVADRFDTSQRTSGTASAISSRATRVSRPYAVSSTSSGRGRS